MLKLELLEERALLAIGDAEIRLAIVDQSPGTPARVNDSFFLEGYVQDGRAAPSNFGVASAYIDVTFDAARASFNTPLGTTFEAPYSDFAEAGTLGAGRISAIGASPTNGDIPANPTSEFLFFRVPFTATATGTITITGVPSTNPALFVSLFTSAAGGAARVTNGDIAFTPASINIVADNTVPTISDVANQVTTEDVAITNLAFTVGDAETAPGLLVVTATSNNQAVIPDGNLVLGGSGANRTITVTPAAQQSGSATITLTVSDGALTATDTFLVNVNASNDLPTISAIADQTIAEDNSTPALAFTIGDVETAATSLTITRSSSNQTLVPDGNIIIGGSGANRTVTVTPAANQFGNATINITVTDGDSGTTVETFLLTVTPSNDLPTISAIADQTIAEDNSTPALAFTIGDVETAATSLTITRSSSNQALVPDGNIVIGGSGANRTVTVTPAANQFGNATINITVTDGDSGTTVETFLLTVTSSNDLPTITSIANQTIDEDTNTGPIAFTIGDAETAIDDLVVSASSSNQSLIPNGNLALIGTGANFSLTATPLANQFGTTTISVQVQDANGGTATETFDVTVTPINDPPSFTKGPDIQVRVNTGPQTFNAWATSISQGPNETGQTLAFQVTGNTNPAVFDVVPSVSSSGTLSFTPSTTVSGTSTITLLLSDNAGGDNASAPQTFVITVMPPEANLPPVISSPATDDTNEDAALVFSTANGNAISFADPDAGSANVTAIFTITGGVATIGETNLVVSGNTSNLVTATGSILALNAAVNGLIFTPTANLNGATAGRIDIAIDDLGATGSGGAMTDSASVAIAITAVNDAPAFTAGPDQTVDEDAAAQSVIGWATGISSGPPDEAGQTLAFQITSNSNAALFSAGPAIGANGTLTYTPAANANGTAIIGVRLTDDGGTGNGGANASAIQTFTISVTALNDAPEITAPATQTTPEDTPLVFTGASLISIQDLDAGNGEIELTLAVSNGTVTLSTLTGLTFQNGTANTQPTLTVRGTRAAINTALDGLLFVPTLDFNGAVQLDVDVSDLGNSGSGGALTDSADVAITVQSVNDPPFITAPLTQSTNEDTQRVFSTANGNAISISDPDAGAGDVQLVLTVTNGTLTLAQTTGLTIGPGANGTAAMTLKGSVANMNAAINGLQFTPTPGFNGTATLTLTANDLGLAGSGGAKTDTETVQITVAALNDAPVISVPAAQTTAEDTTLVFSSTQNNAITVADDSGNNPIQLALGVSGGILTIAPNSGATIVSGQNSSASITLQGTLTQINTALNGLQFVPTANTSGSVNLQLTANDLGNTGGGSLTDSKTVAITVTAVNDPPSFTKGPDQTVNEDSGPRTVANWATALSSGPADEASQTLSFAVSSNNASLFSAGPAIDANGTLTFTPAANVNGTAVVSVTLSDSGGASSAVQTFNITVTAVNDPPSFTKGPDQTVNEDAGPQTVTGWATNISSGPANESAQSQTFAIVSNSNPDLFSVPPAIDPATGTLTYTPRANANTSSNIRIALRDNGGTANGGVDTSATADFTIVVNPVNDAPVNNVPAAQTAFLNTNLVFSAANNNLVAISDVDAGSDPIEATVAINNGTLTLAGTTGLTFSAGDGTADASMTFRGTLSAINTALNGLSYTPTTGFNGTSTLLVTSNDLGHNPSGPLSDSDSVSIQFAVAAISGFVYSDVNLNGVKDSGENGIPNIPITLQGTGASNSAVTRNTSTDSSGRYSFTELPGGTYTVAEAPSPNLNNFTDGEESLGTAGGTKANDLFTVDLSAAPRAENYNFGEEGLTGDKITIRLQLASTPDNVQVILEHSPPAQMLRLAPQTARTVVAQPMRVTSQPAPVVRMLTLSQLAPTVKQAVQLWQQTTITPQQKQVLDRVETRIDDLPAGVLALAQGSQIIVDRDAAGVGWFVDETPEVNEEFQVLEDTLVAPQGVAAIGVDLLSALGHELGHVLGLEHSEAEDLMAESLSAGIRKLPVDAAVDHVFTEIADWRE